MAYGGHIGAGIRLALTLALGRRNSLGYVYLLIGKFTFIYKNEHKCFLPSLAVYALEHLNIFLLLFLLACVK